MKLKFRLSVLSILFCLCLAVSFLGVVPNNKTVFAESDFVDSFYVVQFDQAGNRNFSKSKTALGKTSGYGQFELGKTNASLSAIANNGMKVAGWLLDFADESLDDLFVAETTTLVGTGEDKNAPENANGIVLSISGIGESSSELRFSSVFDNVKVEPVFDYIYYSVQIEDKMFSSFVNTSVNSQDCALGRIHFSEKTEQDGMVYYKKAIVSSFENQIWVRYYLGDISTDGTNFFKIFNDELIKIEDKFAFRYGEYVEMAEFSAQKNFVVESLTKTFKTDFFETEDIKIDKKETGAVGEGFSVQTKSANNPSVNTFKLDFVVEDSFDNTVVLSAEIFDVYSVEVEATTGGRYEADFKQKILDSLSVDKFDGKDGNTYYVVKKSKNPFSIFAPSIYQENGCVYYSFKDLTITTNGNQLTQTNNIFEKNCDEFYSDISISVNYQPQEYSFVFESVVKQGETLKYLTEEQIQDFARIEAVKKERGEVLSFGEIEEQIDSISNIGFVFVGYTDSVENMPVENFDDLGQLSKTISKDNPTDKTIYLCFEYINYSVKIVNSNPNCKLFDGEKDIFAVSKFYVGETEYADFSNLFSETDGTNKYFLLNNIKLGDEIQFSFVKNDGFDIFGFSLDNNKDNLLVDDKFVLSKENITNSNFVVYFMFDYTFYEVNYEISLGNDSATSQQIIMANISATAPEHVIVEETKTDKYGNVDQDSSKNTYTKSLKFVGVRKYDSIALVSEGITVESGVASFVYGFVMFTTDGKVGIGGVSFDGEKAKLNIVVDANRDIFVVYATPVKSFKVAITDSNALDLGDSVEQMMEAISVKEGGNEIVPNSDGIYVINSSFVLNIVKPISFGYVITGYKLDLKGNNIDTTVGNSLQYSAVLGDEDVYTLTIQVQKLDYRFVVTKTGAGFDQDKEEYFDLRVWQENKNLLSELNTMTFEFKKPDGTFVKNAKILYNGNLINDEWFGFAGSNDSRNEKDYIYKYMFSYENFVRIAKDMSSIEVIDGSEKVVVRLNFEFAYYSYTLTINYKLTGDNSAVIDKINFPSVNISGCVVNQTKVGTKIVVEDIPFNSSLKLALNKNWQIGLDGVCWEYLGGNINSYEISIGNIKQDANLNYVFKLHEFNLRLAFESDKGEPTINGARVNSVNATIFTRYLIDTKSIRSNGYEQGDIYWTGFEKLLDITNFESLKNSGKLFVFEYGVCKRVETTSSYDETVDYYYLTEKRLEKSSQLLIEEFGLLDFAPVDESGNITDRIVINIDYNYIQFKIKNIVSIKNAISNIAVGDMCTIIVYRLENNNWVEVTDLNNLTFIVKDEFKIELTFNTIKNYQLSKRFNDTVDVNLGMGLYVKEIKFGNSIFLSNGQIAFDDNGLPKSCVISAYALNYINEVVNNELEIKYQIDRIDNITIASTNVKNQSGIDLVGQDNGISLRLVDDLGNGTTYAETGKSFVQHKKGYLATADTLYYDSAKLKNYFKICSIKVYPIISMTFEGNTVISWEIGKTPVDPSEYAKFGILFNSTQTENGMILDSVLTRYFGNFEIRLVVEPKLYFNGEEVVAQGEYKFSSGFKCDDNGEGIEQELTKGVGGLGSQFDIASSDVVLSAMKVVYENEANFKPKDAGTYNVEISFNQIEDYDFDNLVYYATFTITPLEVKIDYSGAGTSFEKTYDGTCRVKDDIQSRVVDGLYLIDLSNRRINFGENGLSIRKGTDGCLIKTTETRSGAENERFDALESGQNCNLTIYNLKLKSNQSSIKVGNFKLSSSILTIANCITIKQKELRLLDLNILNKVEDGTDKVYFGSMNYKLDGVVSIYDYETQKYVLDNVSIDKDKMAESFKYASVKTSKDPIRIFVENPSSLLSGLSSKNYKLKVDDITSKYIYPYMLEVNGSAFGKITIRNDKARKIDESGNLQYPGLVNIIPLDAELVVEPIYANTNEYRSIYSAIKSYLTRTNVYALGFRVYMISHGEKISLDNNLKMTLNQIDSLTNVIFVSGEDSSRLNYTLEDGQIVVDLSNYDQEIDCVVLTRRRAYIQLWLIILIIVLILLLILAIILTFVIIRRKKLKRYSINDKI